MCGIAGIWWNKGQDADNKVVKKMIDSIAHRGPDAEGIWDSSNGLMLGHRRLSIIDLDPRSNQPFHFLNRYVIIFNGEIYNFLELKRELEKKGTQFNTNSDTEVVCAAFHEWNVNCLEHFDGMFAFAIYDMKSETLFCARDRFGEKPFYYTNNSTGFYFGSEMKVFWEAGIKKQMREKMMYYFLVHDLVEDVENPELTFYKDIYKLQPSHYFIVKKGEVPKQKKYYNPSIETTYTGTFNQAVEHFNYLFNQSIEYRMRAEVQIGSSLSGGMDSSAVTAVMSRFKKGNATFSARFKGFKKDEGQFINIVSKYYETNHFDCYPNQNDFEKQFEKLCFHQEEPFQSGSIFAQYEVYKLAKQQNRLVLLDGQGADEILGGYFKYLIPYYFELTSKTERKDLSKLMLQTQNIHLNPSFKEGFQFLMPILHKKLYGLKNTFLSNNQLGINKDLTNKYGKEQPFNTYKGLKKSLHNSLTHQGLGKLLRFSDRNSMAHSIEVRLPFLSHHLVDFVFSLPANYFFNSGWTKSILRHAVQDVLPSEIVWRKDKVGFEAPHNDWIKSPKLQDKLRESQEHLIEKKIITSSFPLSWKSLILNEFID